MKKAIFLIALVSLSFWAGTYYPKNDDSSSANQKKNYTVLEHEAEARKLVLVVSSFEAEMQGIERLVDSAKEAKKPGVISENYWSDFKRDIKREAKEDLIKKLIVVYGKHLKTNELIGLVKHYKMPLVEKY